MDENNQDNQFAKFLSIIRQLNDAKNNDCAHASTSNTYTAGVTDLENFHLDLDKLVLQCVDYRYKKNYDELYKLLQTHLGPLFDAISNNRIIKSISISQKFVDRIDPALVEVLFETIGTLPSLKHLDYSGNYVPSKMIAKALLSFQSQQEEDCIRKLSWTDYQIDNSIGCNHHLESLKFNGSGWSFCPVLSNALKHCSGLKYLKIYGCKNNLDYFFESLPYLGELVKLEVVGSPMHQIEPGGPMSSTPRVRNSTHYKRRRRENLEDWKNYQLRLTKSIETFLPKSVPNLEQLCFYGNKFHIDCDNVIAYLLSNRKLRELTITSQECRSYVEIAKAIENHPTLETLVLSGSIDDSDCIAFAHYLKHNDKLTSLIIGDCDCYDTQVSVDSIKAFSDAMEQILFLKELSLPDRYIDHSWENTEEFLYSSTANQEYDNCTKNYNKCYENIQFYLDLNRYGRYKLLRNRDINASDKTTPRIVIRNFFVNNIIKTSKHIIRDQQNSPNPNGEDYYRYYNSDEETYFYYDDDDANDYSYSDDTSEDGSVRSICARKKDQLYDLNKLYYWIRNLPLLL